MGRWIAGRRRALPRHGRAIRGCGLAYHWPLVAASVAIAIVASMAALWFTFTVRSMLASLGGGIMHGLAIASMHYTAIAATFFVPLDVPVAFSAPLLGQSALAYLIALGIAVVSGGNLVLLGAMSS
jgi:NO-binding membrane sensor protein with MHYT domain